MSVERLITDNIDVWTSTVKTQSASGRGSSKKIELYGIKKLRELILELAVRGKLVPQDPTDEPASVLLERIAEEKAQLVKEKKIKKSKPLSKFSHEDEPFVLPQGWAWARLGNTGIGATGKTPSTKQTEFFDGTLPFVGPGQITQNGQMLEAEKFLSSAGLLNSTEAIQGDILMVCIGGSIGKAAIATQTMGFNQQINAIRPLQIASDYLYTAVSTNSFYVGLLGKATGSATPIINRGKWEELLVPIAPLSEQHRIVAKVDELMSLCDQLEQQTEISIEGHQTLVEVLLNTLTSSADAQELTQNWQRISEHFDALFTTEKSIDSLKQTILQLAVMGKLVPQDSNDEPAAKLLERIAEEKAQLIKDKKIKKQKALPEITEDEKPFDLPSGWEWERIGTFGIVGTGATPSRNNPKYWDSQDHNWVSSGETAELFVRQTKEKISELAIKETNVSIYPIGTLIVAMYGQGKTRGQITELLEPAGTNQACAAIRLIEISADHKDFVKLYFRKAYEELRSNAAGGAQPNLNVGKIQSTVVAIPPIKEQQRINLKVNNLLLICDQLKTRLKESQTTQLHLTDAIIEKAL